MLLCVCHGLTFSAKDGGPNSYEVASRELREYCIERLCLGMTIKEVSAFGDITWLGNRVPDGQIRCTKGPSISAVGELEAKDGTKFQIRFELVSPQGNSESRYRLMNAGIRLNKVTLLQADHLAQTLKLRYGLMRESAVFRNGPITISSADTKSGLFTASITRVSDPVDSSMKVGLSADYKNEAKWLLSLSECQAGLPKL